MDDAKPLRDPELTTAEVVQYRREGWLLLRGLLDPAHVAHCLAALEHLARGTPPPAAPGALVAAGRCARPAPGRGVPRGGAAHRRRHAAAGGVEGAARAGGQGR